MSTKLPVIRGARVEPPDPFASVADAATRALALQAPPQSVPSTAQARDGSARGSLELVPATYCPVPKAATPQPDHLPRPAVAPRSSSVLGGGPRAGGTRVARHPLQEDRTLYDVWPARSRTKLLAGSRSPGAGGSGKALVEELSQPRLLQELRQALEEDLVRLKARYPGVAPSDCTAVPADDALPALEPRRGRGPKHGAVVALPEGVGRSPQDQYRVDRLAVFRGVAHSVAGHFTAYRHVLRWVAAEYDAFAQHCHANVWSPQARDEFRAAAKAEAAAEVAAALAKAEAERDAAVSAVEAQQAEHQALEAAQRQHGAQVRDLESRLAGREREVREGDQARATLLRRIDRLEAELWQQKELLEVPEARIAELEALADKQKESLRSATLRLGEAAQESERLQARVVKLQEELDDRRRMLAQGYGNAAFRAESLAYKRRELEVLELNASLRATADDMAERLRDAEAALEQRRSAPNGQLTPRPDWGALPRGLLRDGMSSAKKAAGLHESCRELQREADRAQHETGELRALIGAAYRDDPDINRGDVVPEMRAGWFLKPGLGPAVPSYLRGIGKVRSMRMTLPQTLAVVRRFWVQRQQAKVGTPMDAFAARFFQEHRPLDVPADEFALNVTHAVRWYAYDPMVGFTHQLLTRALDEVVFHDMDVAITATHRVLASAARRAPAAPPESTAEPRDRRAGPVRRNSTRPLSPDSEGVTALKTDVIAALVEHSMLREDAEVKRLVLAMSRDCPGKFVDVSVLFAFDAAAGRFSHFLEELYRQYLDDRAVMLHAVLDCVYAAEPDQEGAIPAGPVAAELFAVDPRAPAQHVDSLIARLFDSGPEHLKPTVEPYSGVKHVGVNGERVYAGGLAVTEPLADVVARVRMAPLQRFSRKSTVASCARLREQRLAAERVAKARPDDSQAPAEAEPEDAA